MMPVRNVLKTTWNGVHLFWIRSKNVRTCPHAEHSELHGMNFFLWGVIGGSVDVYRLPLEERFFFNGMTLDSAPRKNIPSYLNLICHITPINPCNFTPKLGLAPNCATWTQSCPVACTHWTKPISLQGMFGLPWMVGISRLIHIADTNLLMDG